MIKTENSSSAEFTTVRLMPFTQTDPYTYEHTNLYEVTVGDTVNLEFDIIGKYVARLTRNNQIS